MKSNRGFTLIELLVVIAIIGVLSAVVLASLNTSRAKAADSAIKANMHTIQIQAEAYYDSNTPNTYGTFWSVPAGITITCPTSGTSMFNAEPTIKNAIANIVAASGANANVNCQSSPTAWTVWAKLKYGVGTDMYWCVDSRGIAKSEPSAYSGSVSNLYICQ